MTTDWVEPPYPFQNHLGFTVADWSKDGCRLELTLQDFHANRHGIPHGGIHAALIDTAMGFAGCFTGDRDAPQLCVTLSLTVNYVGPACGKMMIATGRKVGGGRKSFFAEAEITDETGTLIAKGTGAFRYRTQKD